jgi:DNA-binding NtrC family response regulator
MACAQPLKVPVLLAQSEQQVCNATVDHMIANGFKIIEVASTDEALSSLESRRDTRLMVTAIDMPGCLSGLDLARVVRRRWSHIGTIVLGWPTLPMSSLAHAVTFLSNPCPAASLVEQLSLA